MIEYRNISIAYEKPLLQEDVISLKCGLLTVVWGPSGCGKTALLYRLGLAVRDCDAIFEGQMVKNEDACRRNMVSYVMQENELIPYLSAEDNIREYALTNRNGITAEEIKSLFETVSLRIPLEQDVSLLSLGERQRLCIACALSRNTKVLILDEPTASLDAENRMIIYRLLKNIAQSGRYVIMASHDDTAKSYADVIWKIQNGRIVLEKDADERIGKDTEHHFEPWRFLALHTRNYAYRNRILMLFGNIFLMMSVLLPALFSTWYDTYMEKTREELFAATEKYLYVTDGRNPGYLEKDTIPSSLPEGIPVYRIVIGGTSISVVPRLPGAIKNDMISVKYNSDEHGLWFSYAAQKEYEGVLSDEMHLELMTDDGIVSWDGYCNGVLKQGIRAYELENNELFVLMNPEDIASFSLSSPRGTMIVYDSFEELQESGDSYRDAGLRVNAEAVKYENIMAVTADEQQHYHRIRMILICVTAVLLAGVNLTEFRNRRKEYVLLRMNGIPAGCISILNLMELMPAVLLLMVGGISAGLLYQPFLNNFGIFFLIAVCIEMLLALIRYLRLKKMNLENVLRD